jgi:hypothetical protein
MARKMSENNSHKKVMVDVRGQNLQDTKKENFCLRGAQWIEQL